MHCNGEGAFALPDENGEPELRQCQWCYEVQAIIVSVLADFKRAIELSHYGQIQMVRTALSASRRFADMGALKRGPLAMMAAAVKNHCDLALAQLDDPAESGEPMDPGKRERLEAKGWKFGTAEGFLADIEDAQSDSAKREVGDE